MEGRAKGEAETTGGRGRVGAGAGGGSALTHVRTRSGGGSGIECGSRVMTAATKAQSLVGRGRFRLP